MKYYHRIINWFFARIFFFGSLFIAENADFRLEFIISTAANFAKIIQTRHWTTSQSTHGSYSNFESEKMETKNSKTINLKTAAANEKKIRGK